MNAALLYDGQFIRWNNVGVFKATSGMPGHQIPGEQCIPDAGPVPEGFYKVFVADHGMAQDDGQGICALKPSSGIQHIPRGTQAGKCEPYWANWGKNRARMEPADATTKSRCDPVKRSGFYLHDSVKGYSHGCIEVETSIFPHLRKYHTSTKQQSAILQVKYIGNRLTNGGTEI